MVSDAASKLEPHIASSGIEISSTVDKSLTQTLLSFSVNIHLRYSDVLEVYSPCPYFALFRVQIVFGRSFLLIFCRLIPLPYIFNSFVSFNSKHSCNTVLQIVLLMKFVR
jgi:hypothetical protein